MKKLALVLSLVIAFSASDCFAAKKKKRRKKHKAESSEMMSDSKGEGWSRPYGVAGCGLGSYVVKKKAGFTQVFAATTNGISANQLFGITSGTLNCVNGPTEEVAGRMDDFININKVALATDIAKGRGETIQALASIMGCHNIDQLGLSLQRNFRNIYKNERVHPIELTDSVINVIFQSESLKSDCSGLDLG